MERIVAIDLGSTKTVGVVGEKIDDKCYRILAYSEAPSQGIVRGYVVAPIKVAETVSLVLGNITATFPEAAGIKNVVVGITGNIVKYANYPTSAVHDNANDIITEAEIRRLEKDAYKRHVEAGEEVLHVIPQTYSIDNEDNISDPVGRLGSHISGKFHVIIGSQEASKRIRMSMDKINLSIRQLVFDPLAAAKAVLIEDEKKVGVAMIDIGSGVTKMLVYNNGILIHTSVFLIGGALITRDISQGCGVLNRDAENIKVQYGSCMPSRINPGSKVEIRGIGGRENKVIPLVEVAKIINARLDEIMTMALADIKKCNVKLSAGIVITGGSAKLAHICEFMNQKAEGMYIKTGVPEYISPDSPVKDLASPKYATAVGLLMYGGDYCEKPPVETSVADPVIDPNKDKDKDKDKNIDDRPSWQKMLDAIKKFFTQKEE
jgi:cell division protein FtsA